MKYCLSLILATTLASSASFAQSPKTGNGIDQGQKSISDAKFKGMASAFLQNHCVKCHGGEGGRRHGCRSVLRNGFSRYFANCVWISCGLDGYCSDESRVHCAGAGRIPGVAATVDSPDE